MKILFILLIVAILIAFSVCVAIIVGANIRKSPDAKMRDDEEQIEYLKTLHKGV